MQITLFGAIWIFALIGCFLSADHKKILFMALLSMVFQCNNVLTVGDTGIGVQIFTVGVALGRLLFVKNAKATNRTGTALAVLSVLLLLAVIASLAANQSLNSAHLVSFAMIFVYVLFLVVLSGKALRVDDLWLERTENAILIVVLITGVLQVLCKSGITGLTGILELLVYNDTENSDVIFHSKSLTQFYGTFMEPSYCGAYLVGMFGMIMVRRRLNLLNLLLGICTCLTILLTRSSTAYLGLVVISCLLLVTRAKKKVFKLLMPVFIFGVITLFLYYGDVLDDVLFDKLSSGSYRTRNNWNRWALAAFYSSPVFGIGYRNIRASSLLYSLLAEVGLIGFGVYLAMVVPVLFQAVFASGSPWVKSRAYLVLGIMGCQMIACPDLNFSPFWMAMYMLAVALRIDCAETENRKLVTV